MLTGEAIYGDSLRNRTSSQSEAAKRPMARSHKFIAPLLTIAMCWAGQAGGAIVKVDLREFGYRFTGGAPIGDYTEMSFLSEDLLVVSVNQRSFPGSSASFNSDSPDSMIIVVDLKRGRVIRSGGLPVEKREGSVQPVVGERFAVLNEKGLQVCTVDFRCGAPLGKPGPVFTSPQGKRVVFGGAGLSPRRVLDLESMKQIAAFEALHSEGVIPGDRALLVARGRRSFVQRPGRAETSIQVGTSNFSESRFLSDGTVGYIDGGWKEVRVADLDGNIMHRYKVEDAYRTSLLPTGDGKRFGIYEHGYSFWNRVANFLDIYDTRPENLQRVRVVDVSSGSQVALFEWNPRMLPLGRLIKPQLSPSGHRLAKVEAGVLEVLAFK